MGGSTSTLVDSKDDELNELKCFNCKELLTVLPITLYLNKGNVCGRCPENLYNDGYPNTALEAMIKLQKLPCRYKTNSCSETTDYKEIKKHEESCDYRQYSCPILPLNCTWSGKRSELKQHYEEKHKTSLMEAEYLKLDVKKHIVQNILMQTMKKQFLIQIRIEKSSHILRCGLIYFEEPNENKQYVFTIILKNENNEFKSDIKNSRFIDTYLIRQDELHEINFNRIELLINNAPTLQYKITITEEDK